MSLLSVGEARARILALAPDLPVEEVALADAAGRVAATDLFARRTQPAADLSAMDGYAIRFAERPGPWRIVGESAAGRAFDDALAAGEAVRIFTGAALPPGADTILVQEDADRDGDRLDMTGSGPARPGTHIRRAGFDFHEGDRLIAAGEPLTPARIALAIGAGHGGVAVRAVPRVALISTGDELVPPGAPAPGVLLPASNGAMLAALLARALPVEVTDLGIVPDDLGAMAAALDRVRDADVIVTVGGASVGDHDLVRPALLAAGAIVDFWRIAMQPGRPVIAGRLGRSTVLGLPGNPVSAFVTAWLLLVPMLRRAAGDRTRVRRHAARLAAPMPATGGRTQFVRAVHAGARVRPLREQDSAGLTALARSELLILRRPHSPPAPAGKFVEIIATA